MDEIKRLERKNKIYIQLVRQYTRFTELNSGKILELKSESAAAPELVAPVKQPAAPAPSSASKSVQKTPEEEKLEKIKDLLQANEQIISRCGFEVGPIA